MRFSCTGQGPGPVVILESAFGMPLEYWQETQAAVAKFTKVCSYDRFGDAADYADDLHTLLALADIHPPYILVGHSLGGICARVFTSRFPSQVAGLVFVDSSHEEQLWREREITQRESVSSVNFSGFLPRPEVLKWQCDIPTVVIQRGLPERSSDFTQDELESLEALWRDLQSDLARRSKYAKLVTAAGSDHMIPLKDPSIVIASIREVFDQLQPLTREWGVNREHGLAATVA